MATTSAAPQSPSPYPFELDASMITMARYLYQLLLVVDFSRIQAKVHATDDGVDDYKKYLAMSAMVKNVGFQAILFSPSDDMDAVWHAHILDTRAYRECCELLLGPNGSIDHDPYGSEDPHVRKARRSFAMISFHSIFGEHPKRGWGPDPCPDDGGFLHRPTPTPTDQDYEISVKSLDRRVTTVKVHGSWMVEDLKTAVELQLGTPYDQQRLIFVGAEFADGCTLGDYRIPPDATVHLVTQQIRGC